MAHMSRRHSVSLPISQVAHQHFETEWFAPALPQPICQAAQSQEVRHNPATSPYPDNHTHASDCVFCRPTFFPHHVQQCQNLRRQRPATTACTAPSTTVISGHHEPNQVLTREVSPPTNAISPRYACPGDVRRSNYAGDRSVNVEARTFLDSLSRVCTATHDRERQMANMKRPEFYLEQSAILQKHTHRTRPSTTQFLSHGLCQQKENL